MYKLKIHICTWKENEDGYHDTFCDHSFSFEAGTLKENGFVWCPFCGGKIRQSKYKGGK